jgi:hypothetical protein
VKHVVFGLLHEGWDQVFPPGYAVSVHNLLGAPLAGSPVKSFSLLYDLVHRPDSLLDRRIDIRPVAKEQIHVIHLQSLER